MAQTAAQIKYLQRIKTIENETGSRQLGTLLREFVNVELEGGTNFENALAKATPRAVSNVLPLSEFRKIAAMSTALASTAGTSLLGFSGTAGAPLLGTATSNNSVTETASYVYTLPADYVAGAAISVIVRAKVSVLSQVTKTIGASAKLIGDGAVGSNLIATAAAVLTAAYANYTFVVTPTGLVAGNQLQLDFTTINDDTGGAHSGAISISAVTVQPTITT